MRILIGNDDGYKYEWSLKEDAENKKLLLYSFSPEFSTLFSVKDTDIGKTVENIVDKKTAETIYDTYTELLCNKDILTTVEERGGSFWNIQIEYAKPFVKISAVKIKNTNDLNTVNSLNSVLLESFKTGTDNTVVLKENNGQFIIFSISDKTSEITNLKVGDNINDAITNMYMLKSTILLKHCLKTNKSARILDKYKNADCNFLSYLFIIFFPVCHKEHYIFIIFHSIEKDIFYNIQQKSALSLISEYNDSFVAISSYVKDTENHYSIKYSNSKFDIIIDDDKKKELLYSLVIKKCIEYMSVQHSKTIIGNVEHYIFGIPDTHKNKIFVLILNTQDFSRSVERILAMLTKREKEIAQMLIDGHTIKYISYTLKIAEGTAKKTISNIYKKVGVNSRVELIRKVFNA